MKKNIKKLSAKATDKNDTQARQKLRDAGTKPTMCAPL